MYEVLLGSIHRDWATAYSEVPTRPSKFIGCAGPNRYDNQIKKIKKKLNRVLNIIEW